MRIFLAGTPCAGITQLRGWLSAAYGLEPLTFARSEELASTPLRERMLFEYTGHPDALLLEFLPRNGFKILTAALHRDFEPDARPSLSLEWSCVENSLVISLEELARDPAATVAHISRHLGSEPASDPTGLAQPASSVIADVEARNRRLAEELAHSRAQHASLLPRFQQAAGDTSNLSEEISRLQHLLYGASVGQHLYRAWQVLRGNKHYRRPPYADSHSASVDPHDISGYLDLFIDDLHVRFHKAALADNRGTGRVARELFREFELLACAPDPRHPAPRRIVHFFAAPH